MKKRTKNVNCQILQLILEIKHCSFKTFTNIKLLAKIIK